MYERICPRRCTTNAPCKGNVRGRLFNPGCFIVNEKCWLVLPRAVRWMVQFGNFLQKERIVRVMLAEPLELFARADRVLVAKIVKSQQDTGKRHEKTAMIGNQRQLFYTLFLVTFEAAQPQHPADRRSFAADNVFAHAGSNVGVVIVGG